MYRIAFRDVTPQELRDMTTWLAENVYPHRSDIEELVVNLAKESGERLWSVEAYYSFNTPNTYDFRDYIFRFSHYQDMILFKLRWN